MRDASSKDAWWAVSIVAAALTLAGCRNGTSTATARGARVVVCADTDGWIVPCGCTANQSGGLLRRATYLKELRRQYDVLYFDAGGAAGNDAPQNLPDGSASKYQMEKLAAILDGERLMGVAAHNLGQSELEFGAAALADLASRTSVPFVSANTRTVSGTALAPALRLATAGGRRFAIVGVVWPGYSIAGITIGDPRTAIADASAANRGRYDSLIVLAYMPQDALEALAAEVPDADAIIGGPTIQALQPRKIGPALLASSTNKGKFLVQLAPPAATGESWTGRVDEIASTLTDDPGQVENLHSYLRRLAALDLPADQTGLVPPIPSGSPAGYRIAGSESCLTCHVSDSAAWHSSGHASAWTPLVNAGFAVDSYCQQCHTTGFAMPGGFESPATSASRVGVGCESCHGPSAAHVADPSRPTPFAAFDQCVRCHDTENSPNFDRTTYWAKIQHGTLIKPATTEAK